VALSKKSDPKRRWRSFKRHGALLTKTFILSAIVTYAWYEAWTHGLHFPEDDKDVIIGAVITTFGVLYSITLSWIMIKVWDVYQKIVLAVLEQDKHVFLLYRDERMPIAFHLIIGAVSTPLLGMIGAIAYKHLLTGGISVFVVSLILILSWLVAAQIESPTKHGWFAERIPEDWFTEDIDKFFGLGPQYRGKKREADNHHKSERHE